MSMFKKYLLKRQFWPLPRKPESNTPPCLVYHSDRAGGIYAYLLEHGVIIKSSRGLVKFLNFQDLDAYLDTFGMGRPPRFETLQEIGLSNPHLPYEKIPM